ncbi:MAG: HTH-type transcriptional activator IlvY [Gammaproteobacteria bacterium]|nr:MAG: HTH-type transcriptional activator IlvY [Gammaproteobacteria bacterium]
MDIKSLQMFQHLARSLHFGKTAQVYFVSPSTLSRTIQRLENQLGCNLLHRDNRTVMLTDSGKKFLTYADNQLEQWQQLQQTLNQQQAQLTGKLHIYCSVTAAYSHLPPLLDKFRQQHPLVEIMLTTGDAADALEQVQQKIVDIAIAANPDNLSKSLFFQPIAEIPLAVIAPTISCKVQQLVEQKQLNWSNIPIILPEHGPARKRFEQWYRQKQQGKANIYATVSGHEALVSMVALGCGVGISPKVVVDNSPVKDRVQYLQNVGDIAPFELGVCCLKSRQEQAMITAFLQAIPQKI